MLDSFLRDLLTSSCSDSSEALMGQKILEYVSSDYYPTSKKYLGGNFHNCVAKFSLTLVCVLLHSDVTRKAGNYSKDYSIPALLSRTYHLEVCTLIFLHTHTFCQTHV